ncbi:hypothetical protein nACB1_016 [Acinetobacter phage nACB1]|nr:hypothetical protein nACB1_016 [Acinetobacter phage nACB1]
MQQRGREYRIKQQQRKKQKAAKQFKDNEWKSSDKAIGIHANTPARCSCDMCGNPRKHHGNGKHGRTLEEQKPVLQECISEGQLMSELELMD